MAGRGPAPAEKRRRSNEPARGEWVDLVPLEVPVLPELQGLPGRTYELWEAWRRDPVTAQWSPADVAFARETIALHAQDADMKQASEVRLRMDSLGLTPKGKRDLRWRIVEAEAPKQTRPKRSNGERRARLSVVA